MKRRMAREQRRDEPAPTPGQPPAPEEDYGPWKGMRPPYANPSAIPTDRRQRPARPVPYRDVLAGFPNAVVFLAGVWLLVCPWLLEHPATAAGFGAEVNDLVLGLALTVLGGFRAVSPFRSAWAGWTVLVLGCWLIVAPFALDYTGGDRTAATVNDVVTGAAVLALTVLSMALAARWGPEWNAAVAAGRDPQGQDSGEGSETA